MKSFLFSVLALYICHVFASRPDPHRGLLNALLNVGKDMVPFQGDSAREEDDVVTNAEWVHDEDATERAFLIFLAMKSQIGYLAIAPNEILIIIIDHMMSGVRLGPSNHFYQVGSSPKKQVFSLTGSYENDLHHSCDGSYTTSFGNIRKAFVSQSESESDGSWED